LAERDGLLDAAVTIKCDLAKANIPHATSVIKEALILIGVLMAGLLVIWNIRRVLRFENDYAFSGTFEGTRHECPVGGLNLRHDTLSFAGADKIGLYLLQHPDKDEFMATWRRQWVLKKNLMIPWKDMTYRRGKVRLKECVWFEMASRRVYLSVPSAIGELLLKDAGLPIG
jgi:hypothetical protein